MRRCWGAFRREAAGRAMRARWHAPAPVRRVPDGPALNYPPIAVYAGRRGDPDAGAGVLHASAPNPPTKDGLVLVKDLSAFRKPRYDYLYAITITLLIQAKGFDR